MVVDFQGWTRFCGVMYWKKADETPKTDQQHVDDQKSLYIFDWNEYSRNFQVPDM